MRLTEAEFVELQKRMATKTKYGDVPLNAQIHQAMQPPSVTTVTPAEHPPRKSKDEEKLNKTEKRFLAHLRLLGIEPGIQNVTVKLADDCRLTPDFTYYDENDRFILVDTKGGFTREDAFIKMKMAARKFPRWIWRIARYEHGSWEYQELNP